MLEKHIILRDQAVRTEDLGAGVGTRSRGDRAPRPHLEIESLEPSDRAELARDPEVVAISPEMPIALIRPFEVPEAEAATTAWGVEAVGAADTALTGAGVKVAVLDTGIDAGHPAFSGVALTQRDFSGSGDGDRNGHGTHCAGTIFGRDVAGTRIGVARGVDAALIGKVLGDDGSGSSEMIFEAISWASEEGADVISMSLGFDFPGLVERLIGFGWPADLATSVALEAYRGNLRMFDALMEVIEARAAFGPGTLVIAAAGNESRRDENPNFEIAASLPAAASGVISVAAAGDDPEGYRIADFSNTLATLTGPGVNVLSARAGGGLRALRGTSMACPHVAGVAALLWQEVRTDDTVRTAATVEARLRARADASRFAPGTQVADRGLGMVRVGGSAATPVAADAGADRATA